MRPRVSSSRGCSGACWLGRFGAEPGALKAAQISGEAFAGVRTAIRRRTAHPLDPDFQSRVFSAWTAVKDSTPRNRDRVRPESADMVMEG
jgi:hypothetical protein